MSRARVAEAASELRIALASNVYENFGAQVIDSNNLIVMSRVKAAYKLLCARSTKKRSTLHEHPYDGTSPTDTD